MMRDEGEILLLLFNLNHKPLMENDNNYQTSFTHIAMSYNFVSEGWWLISKRSHLCVYTHLLNDNYLNKENKDNQTTKINIPITTSPKAYINTTESDTHARQSTANAIMKLHIIWVKFTLVVISIYFRRSLLT